MRLLWCEKKLIIEGIISLELCKLANKLFLLHNKSLVKRPLNLFFWKWLIEIACQNYELKE
jgi:hypothetical protein